MSTVNTFKYVDGNGFEPGFINKPPLIQNENKLPGGRKDNMYGQKQKNAKKIKVKDGDKCVAPAKSKAKHRKNLGDADLGYNLSMDNVQWSNESYKVRDVISMFGADFPTLLKVTKEYALDENKDFLQGQVIQVHAFSHQDRLIVIDDAGTTFSVPLDYNITVELPKPDKSIEKLSLHEAVKKSPLPVQLFVLEMSENIRHHDVNLSGRHITILKADEDLYLRASTINDGWINQYSIAVIPEFLGMEFAIARGVSGATGDEWKDFQNMYNRTVRMLHQEPVPGFPGVVTLDKNNCAISGFKSLTVEELDVLTSLTDVNNSLSDLNGHMSSSNSHVTKKGYDENKENVYQNIGNSETSLTGSWQRDEDTGSHSWKSSSIGTLDVRRTPQKGTTPSIREELEPPEVNRAIRPRTDNVVVHRSNSGVVNPAYTHDARNSVNLEEEEHTYGNAPSRLVRAKSISSEVPSKHRSTVNEAKVTELLDMAITNGESNEGAAINNRRNTPAFHSAREPRSPSQHSETTFINKQMSPSSGAVRGNVSSVWLKKQQRSSGQTPPPVKSKPTVGVVEPTRHLQSSNPQQPQYGVSINIGNPSANTVHAKVFASSSSAQKISTIEDIPEDVDSLTVEQLCDCLTLLSMGSHISTIRARQIDGALLSGLKESTLVSDLGFTEFHASKLARFIRGWRPKLI